MTDIMRFVKEWNETSAIKGREEFINRQQAIGEKRGEKRGEAKGRKESNIEIAKKMILKNYSADSIIEITGLNEKELAKIKAEC